MLTSGGVVAAAGISVFSSLTWDLTTYGKKDDCLDSPAYWKYNLRRGPNRQCPPTLVGVFLVSLCGSLPPQALCSPHKKSGAFTPDFCLSRNQVYTPCSILATSMLLTITQKSIYKSIILQIFEI